MTRRGRRFVVFGAAALLSCGVTLVAGVGPVIGEDARLVAARRLCDRRGTDAMKLEGMRALASIDSSASRRLLEEYAQAKDRRLSVAAITTIGRADYAGARSLLQHTFEDDSLPHTSRAMAFASWARLAVKDGVSWETIEAYAKEHCARGSALEDSVLATKNALAPATSGGK